jgi:hypothetical protein
MKPLLDGIKNNFEHRKGSRNTLAQREGSASTRNPVALCAFKG